MDLATSLSVFNGLINPIETQHRVSVQPPLSQHTVQWIQVLTDVRLTELKGTRVFNNKATVS